MKRRLLLIVMASLLGLGLIGYALLYTPTSSRNESIAISSEELSLHNGIDGNECWVAVDGVVYAISGFSQWSMGRHLPSNGKATCGRDLSGVIGESPHGKSILQLLKKVGEFRP